MYGSRAKENYRPSSDIDIALRGGELTYQELARIDKELDDLLLPYSIDLSVYEQIDNSDFIEHVKRVGQVFYSKEE